MAFSRWTGVFASRSVKETTKPEEEEEWQLLEGAHDEGETDNRISEVIAFDEFEELEDVVPKAISKPALKPRGPQQEARLRHATQQTSQVPAPTFNPTAAAFAPKKTAPDTVIPPADTVKLSTSDLEKIYAGHYAIETRIEHVKDANYGKMPELQRRSAIWKVFESMPQVKSNKYDRPFVRAIAIEEDVELLIQTLNAEWKLRLESTLLDLKDAIEELRIKYGRRISQELRRDARIGKHLGWKMK